MASFVLNPGTGAQEKLEAVFSERSLPVGSVIRVETPSGGGYGDPLARDPERVLADTLAGKVSVEGAERDYGVVVVDGRIDAVATERTRERRRS